MEIAIWILVVLVMHIAWRGYQILDMLSRIDGHLREILGTQTSDSLFIRGCSGWGQLSAEYLRDILGTVKK